jgi:hypothetical protein
MLAVLVGAAALLVGTGGAASASLSSSGGGCASVTVDRVFGEVCTFTWPTNAHVGWYPGEGSPGARIQLALRMTGPATDRIVKVDQVGASGPDPISHNWSDEPYEAGYCYAAVVYINKVPVEAPAICA